ncbi:hypothetical protein KBD49_03765 [Myxococcota bacterium]|jgi:hypothetical protein|nr:hypothetical protein [Myxococcota bacterium]
MADGPDSGPAEETSGRRAVDGVLDLARKAVGTSVKSLLNSEEGLRQILGAVIPKEVGQAVRAELSELRRDFLAASVRELNRFLEHVDPAKELQRLLTDLVFDIRIQVGIRRRDAVTDGGPEGAPRKAPAGPRRKSPSARTLKR